MFEAGNLIKLGTLINAMEKTTAKEELNRRQESEVISCQLAMPWESFQGILAAGFITLYQCFKRLRHSLGVFERVLQELQP